MVARGGIEVLLSKRRTGHADSRLYHVATTPVRVLLYASPRCVLTRPHDYKLQFCNKNVACETICGVPRDLLYEDLLYANRTSREAQLVTGAGAF